MALIGAAAVVIGLALILLGGAALTIILLDRTSGTILSDGVERE